jgi:DNA-binding response OmpR family regulator
MPNEQQIILVDDEPEVRERLRKKLEAAGHTVIAEVGSLADLKQVLNTFVVPATIAIIDGLDGAGAYAAQLLRDAFPLIIIISYSGNEQSFGNYNLKKGKTLSREVAEFVTNLA